MVWVRVRHGKLWNAVRILGSLRWRHARIDTTEQHLKITHRDVSMHIPGHNADFDGLALGRFDGIDIPMIRTVLLRRARRVL